jgi:pilus assembly protein FimV
MPDLEAPPANAESAPADAALVQTPSTDTQPAAVEAPATDAGADTEEDAVDDAADLEDVEVNLAKAYLDMGDPDGARAILEGMLNDPDNADRAALARRTMRRFGLQPSLPPAAEPEA